jgi:hypothetical protein
MKKIYLLLSLLILLVASCKKEKSAKSTPSVPSASVPANPIISFKFYNVDGIQTYNINNLSYRLKKYTIETIPQTAVSSSLIVYQCNSSASSSPYDCVDLDSTYVMLPSTSANEVCSTTLTAGEHMVLDFTLYNSGVVISGTGAVFYDGVTPNSSEFCVKSVGTTSNPKYDVYVKIL